MTRDFRFRLNQRQPLLGTLVTLDSPTVAEILAQAGFDWLFIDMEHSPLDPAAAQAILQAVGDKCPCVLRAPLNDEIWIKKALDVGAAGIIVPQVNSAVEAERVVRRAKFPPQGTRGVGVARANAYGTGLAEYLSRANDEIAIIVQIESAAAVNAIDDILKVEGVDAVFVGPYDLSSSMGKPGQVADAEVQSAIARVKQAALASDKSLGIFAASAEVAKAYFNDGYNLIAVGVDTLFLANAARDALTTLRGD
jgi:2-dehydro-3-deoxyglucarate aldolase/4-hydroxy-2-oxoheptanedioate aldolase